MTDTKQPERFSERNSFNFAQVEGALCAWEWLLEVRAKPTGEVGQIIDGWWDGLGSPGMRMCAMQAGDICDRAFKHMEAMGYEFAGAYDFEFVPDLCAMLDWNALCGDNQFNDGIYDPDIDALVVAMIAAEKSRQPDHKRRLFQSTTPTPEEYIAACRREAERQWGYGDLVSDHPERITAAMEAGQSPTEITYELGVKYDLIPKDGYLG